MAVTGGIRARAGVVFVDVRPDLDGFSRTISSKTTSNKFANAGKLMGKALLAGVGAVGVGAAIVGKLAVDAAVEAEKVMAQTDAVIKSTGGAAKVTAKDVSSMAERIMNLSGVSDETVASGENLLLTFTNIRNTVKGEFVGVFDEATMAITDMSIALDQDMKSSAIQVGKALNDPIKGLTALQRVGVAFTDDQKEMVKRWVEHGDVVRAQKFILAELNKEFGGSAKAMGETTAGKVNILKERFGNLMEEVGFKLIPVLLRLTTWATEYLPKAFAFVEKAIRSVVGWFRSGSEEAGGLTTAFAGVLAWAQKVWPQVQEIISGVVAVVQELWARWGESIMAIAKRAWSYIGQIIQNVLRIVGGVIRLFLAVIQGDWGAAWNAIKDIVGGVWEAIKDSISNSIGFIKDIIIAGWRTIKNVVADIVGGMLAFLVNAFADFVKFWFGVADAVLAGAELAFGWVPKIGPRIEKFRDKFEKVGEDIVGSLHDQADAFQGMGESAREQLGLTLVAWRRFKQGVEARVKLNIGGWSGEVGGGFGSSMGLVAVGHRLQDGGYLVGEHPAFGGVGAGHAPGSYHYQGRAIDVNWPGAGETSRLNALGAALRSSLGRRIKELFFPGYDPVGGHQSHLHLAMDRGGIVKGPATIHQGNIWEAHIPLSGSVAQTMGPQRIEGELVLRDGKSWFRGTLRQVLREP